MIFAGRVFEFNAQTVQPSFVLEQAFHLAVHSFLERIGQFEMDAGQNQVVVAH
jgi:hypothetical protein